MDLTERANQALSLASEAARRQRAPLIGTVHILLGVITELGMAGAVFEDLGVNLDRLRQKLEENVFSEPSGPDDGPFSAPARSALELALDAGASMGGFAGTEHLLLGLVRETEGQAAGILKGLGVGENEVIQSIEKLCSPASIKELLKRLAHVDNSDDS